MNETRATRYQRLRRRSRAAATASGVVAIVIVALTPLGPWLAAIVDAYGRSLPPVPHGIVSVSLFVIVLVVLWEIASLPAMLYFARRVEARFAAARAPALADVFGAQVGSTLVVLPAAWTAAVVVHGAARLAGGAWWLVAGVLLAIVMVAALHGGPALLARLSGARPLTRPALVERLAALARRARVPIDSIDVVPDERGEATALVAGVGARRRVFLSSEMALNWSDDEIEVVVAHELGHHAHHDLWRTLALDATVLCAGLGAAALGIGAVSRAGVIPPVEQVAALPMIALITGAVWLAATPIRHAFSRAQERRADEFALALTGAADAFSAAVRRLGARHLAEERPSALTRWLHHRHPSVAERLALASRVKK